MRCISPAKGHRCVSYLLPSTALRSLTPPARYVTSGARHPATRTSMPTASGCRRPGRSRCSWRPRHKQVSVAHPQRQTKSENNSRRRLDYSRWDSLDDDEPAPRALVEPPRARQPSAQPPNSAGPMPPSNKPPPNSSAGPKPPPNKLPPPKRPLAAPSALSAAEFKALQARLLFYLEPLRHPPPADAPPTRLQCDLTRHAWERLHADPPIWSCDDFLSAAECEALIGLAARRGLERSKTGSHLQDGVKFAPIKPGEPGYVKRSSSSCTLAHTEPCAAFLTSRIEALARVDWSRLEPMALSRYNVGEEYTAQCVITEARRRGARDGSGPRSGRMARRLRWARDGSEARSVRDGSAADSRAVLHTRSQPGRPEPRARAGDGRRDAVLCAGRPAGRHGAVLPQRRGAGRRDGLSQSRRTGVQRRLEPGRTPVSRGP